MTFSQFLSILRARWWAALLVFLLIVLQPDLGTPTAGHHAFVRSARQLPDADGAKAQVDAQVARAFDGGKVARVLVPLDAAQEVVEQPLRAAGARGQIELR